MPTAKPVIKPGDVDARGQTPVYLRLTHRRKTRYVAAGIRIPPRHWNARAGRVRKGHPNADAINAHIEARLLEAERLSLDLAARGPFTVDDWRARLEGQDEADFFAFADEVISDLKRRGQIYTHKRYKSCVKKFRAFTGEPLPFEAVTPELLRRYETHLLTHYGNSPNTARVNFNAIRAIYYRAIREGKADQATNPFFAFQPVKERPTRRAKLTYEEVRRIEDLPLKEGSLLWHVRNYWLFSFYCAGIRFGDLAKLTGEALREEGRGIRLTYRMSKTGSTKSIKLLPPARAILTRYWPERLPGPEEYVFPLLAGRDVSTPEKLVSAISARNALVNKYLKQLARRAGIDKHLSFHVSRHSFADMARTKGMDLYSISKALGHANVQVTERYLKGFDAGALDEAMEALFDDHA
ncbi:MAG: phage integrase [Rhodothermaceae bacterium]|nr:MAG: phage integrase [Rhodothermaceae bacterium]